MKTTAALSLLALGSASAFAPAAQKASASTRLSAAADFEGMPGVSLEAGGKFFDPLGISEYGPADWLRKGELSNGRAAMLANVGWFWPKVAGTFDSDDVTTTDPIEAISQADAQWWAQFLLLCGVIEGVKYRAELEGKSYTGDGPAAFDYAKQWDNLDAQKKEDMRLSELKNGRLAMIGFASYVADYYIPGSVPPLSFFK